MKRFALLLLVLVAACTPVIEPSVPDLQNTVWQADGIRLSLWEGTMASLRVPRGDHGAIIVYWGSYHIGHTRIVFRSQSEFPLENAYLISENQMRTILDDSVQVRLRRVEGEVPE